ncbi:Druantia anti-phage system protein DruA [Mesorhizobium sp. LNJC391B00]|uniref:Druantia anti-phage system protein DruA n=1 Tax=Mesorhizobium sp. LNJC391B00 TaxID=1287273 RepID=UPI0003CF03F9|nr:Druantia anti-phage system protein DruA [Mesorhizobium sp. LNJC391B00]ESY17003.1 hypothetical protein X749_31430 [Mesorhizobium sp. LNJC391B00]
MSEREDHFGPGRFRAFSPFLAPDERKELHLLLNFAEGSPPSFADALRSLARRYVDDGSSAKLRAVCLLVADLFEQGWRIAVDEDQILFEPPGIARTDSQTVDEVKARVRAALQIARQRQLREPAVATFLRHMERRTVRPPGVRSSVLDLIDEGAVLAKELRRVSKLPEADRVAALASVVDPVVEICHSGARCSDTGLPLIDIWRYFRHTWAHEYRAIPGRQLLILVRNAARRNRPVIGIAMLASPVMRVSVRDKWIGWLRDEAETRLNDGRWEPSALAAALLARLEESIAAIRWDDLATAAEMVEPTESTVLRLEQKASGAAFARELELRAHYEIEREVGEKIRPMRGALKHAGHEPDWLGASEDLLFVRKRAEVLSHLLFAKQMFRAAGLTSNPSAALEQLLAARSGQRAIDIVLTEFRKAGLSSRVADVSVCGAIHPYNEILGGKLVALLLASREVHEAYSERYSSQVSVIASQMAGRPILKPADLRVLTTTSLYGIGSSQYNRLSLKAAHHPGLSTDVRWNAIGKSLTGGFGTLHLGSETAQALRIMAETRHVSRRVNNRFGEGTSPRLRQIREGLDALGLESDTILHHATPRLFYACELGPDSRDALFGMEAADFRPETSAAIGEAWRQRWLSGRSQREKTLEAMADLGPASVQASLRPPSNADLLDSVAAG